MTTKEAIWGNNATSANTSFEWGPSTLHSVYKLLRVQIDISFGFPGTNLAPTANVLAQTAWGVQYVTSGSSPLAIPTNLSAFEYVIADLAIGDSTGTVSWTPPTNDVGVIAFATLRREWYGNRVIEGDIDLWVNYAPIVGAGSSIAASWMMRVDYV